MSTSQGLREELVANSARVGGSEGGGRSRPCHLQESPPRQGGLRGLGVWTQSGWKQAPA